MYLLDTKLVSISAENFCWNDNIYGRRMSKLDFWSYYVLYHLKELNSTKEAENESREEDRLKMDMLKRGKEAKHQLKKKCGIVTLITYLSWTAKSIWIKTASWRVPSLSIFTSIFSCDRVIQVIQWTIFILKQLLIHTSNMWGPDQIQMKGRIILQHSFNNFLNICHIAAVVLVNPR